MQKFRCLLVTGAGGFVGQHLLPRLKEAFPTAKVIAGVRLEDGQLPSISGADHIVSFDVQCQATEEIIAEIRPDGLIHLASQASVAASFEDPLTTWHTNLIGTIRLAEAVLRHANHCRFVLASSAEIYGLSFQAGAPVDEAALLCPTNPYAASKAASDLAIGELSLRGLNAIRLRAFNHTGSGQSEKFVVANFARQIARIEAGQQAPIMQVGALDRWRDFLDVSDVCAAYVAALTANTVGGSIYNIASGQPRRIGDILNALVLRSSARPRVEVEELRLRPTDVERVVGVSTRAARDLGWRPIIPWEDTLANVLDDWRSRITQMSV